MPIVRRCRFLAMGVITEELRVSAAHPVSDAAAENEAAH